ncbi:MAG: translation initiation factor IF-2 [Alphaproteobacteria bacterium]
MSQNDQDNKLTLRRPGRLELKKTVETGQVRQSFSHGRSKTVMVEVKKKRTFERGDAGGMQPVASEPEVVETPPPAAPAPVRSERPAPAPAAAKGGLTNEERASRIRALQGAAQDEERRRQEEAEEARIREEEERLEREADARRQAEESAQQKTADKAEPSAEAQAPAAAPAPARAPASAEAPRPPVDAEEDEEGRAAARKAGRGSGAADPRRAAVPRTTRQEPRRRTGKLTISQALDAAEGSEEDRAGRSMAALRRARERERQRQRDAQLRREGGGKIVRDVVVPETITVADLANRMAERGAEVVKTLMRLGVMATINQAIDADTAELVVAEFGHRIRRVSESDVEIGLEAVQEEEGDLVARAPVVTIMGHVDHGKTSLLDALRSTDVAAGEAGGITQHIGAYQVTLSSGSHITFLDTPGHAAFTQMRARGAKVTDIVVLVVAADDGVQPQTAEAIAHAKAAGVPMIVAINKIDRPDANPDRVRQDLLHHEIVVEQMGGDVQDVEVSAIKKTNLDKLEEAILLQAEILELRANPATSARGTVVEAKLERGRGAVATVLIQSGTLRVGDVFIAGSEWGRVRALVDDKGRPIQEAGPAMPVEVLGMQGTPAAGDDFIVVADEARARDVSEYRRRQERKVNIASTGRGSLEQMFDQIKAGAAAEVPVLVKGDVQGSVEAIVGALEQMSTDEVKVRVLHGAVGGITESDVTLARASNGFIIGFNVRANPQAREAARRDNVDIRYYSIIYEVLDDVKQMLAGKLAPEMRETFLGYAQIRQVFGITKVGKVAGCMVTQGEVKRGAKVRLLRDDVVIYEGALKQLKRFKDDVREVQQGYECGMAFENYDDIKEGDVVECFEVEAVARSL